MDPKTLFMNTARSMGLTACGACSIHFSEELSERLSQAGPVPFAPTEAEKRLSPEALLPGAESFFVILFPYKTEDRERGNIALYARPEDYHHLNHRYMERIISAVKAVYPEAECKALTDTSPMVDRWLAYTAGLGFFGRNHCLIHPVYGSYVTIGAILTTLSLTPDKPLTLSCGDCHLCEKACPGKIIGKDPFNPWHCKSYLTQKKEELTEEEKNIIGKTPLIFGCDACQDCCPFNRKAPPSPLPEIRENRIPTLTREMMESLSNRSFDKTYKNYAFAWRGKKVLLRNWDIVHEKGAADAAPGAEGSKDSEDSEKKGS